MQLVEWVGDTGDPGLSVCWGDLLSAGPDLFLLMSWVKNAAQLEGDVALGNWDRVGFVL